MSRPSLVPELYVSNLDASLQFYVDLLGFQVEYERKAEGFCCLSLDGAWLMLEQVSDRSPASSHELAEGRWLTARLERPFGRGVNFEITVADLASIVARFEESGKQPLLTTHERVYEVDGFARAFRVLLASDPDGYLIRLSEPISRD